MSEDEAARRQQEINMFAAMAQGDGSEFTSGTFDSGAFSAVAPSAPEPSPAEDPSRMLFAAQGALGADPSGTFNLQDQGLGSVSQNTNPARSFVKNHNLEAAAAALADDDDPGTHTDAPMHGQGMFMQQNAASQTQPEAFPKLAPRTPMHIQQVHLPKPLFFGCQLPPRVVKEAREIVRNCRKDKPFPPEVRNLLSAIRTHGHGLDLLQENSKSTPYVSVYCPKWSRILPSKAEESSTLFETPADHWNESPLQGAFCAPEAAAATAAVEAAAESSSSGHSQVRVETAAGQDSAEEGATVSTTSLSVDTASNFSERDLFSMWARGDDSGGRSGGASSPTNTDTAASDGSIGGVERSPLNRENSLGSVSSLRRNSGGSVSGSASGIMNDRDLFSQWARGESPRGEGSTRALMGNSGNSMVFHSNSGAANSKSKSKSKENSTMVSSMNDSVVNTGSVNFFNSGTFMNLPPAEDSDDDDELVVSEMKKKVGVNEHLNAALAYLEEDQHDTRHITENSGMEESNNKLARVPLTPDGGRALTNHELMNGISPLFGFDDSPLPTEADLGIHETRDEQQRSRDQRRNQAIIENCCPQNIFGPLACPNPAMHPDDNHSWMSRATPPTQSRGPPVTGFRQHSVPQTVFHSKLGVLPTPDLPEGKPPSVPRGNLRTSTPAPPKPAKAPHLADKKFDPRSRYGWWNVPDDGEPTQSGLGVKEESSCAGNESSGSLKILDFSQGEEPPLQLPPLGHPASNVLIQTRLEPQPEKLQEQNRPLSQLHPATSLAQSLPFLSDRPPSYRYFQIDTQAVGFLGLGGEIEPLFCSLAIYHVETIAPNTTKDPSLAPIPDLQRCGKVTETLNFDVISDPIVEDRCGGALWPYESKEKNDRFQGTRCGVFPLPSNLNIHNLYAILIVHKVVSEGSDFEAYLKPSKSSSGSETDGTDTPMDLDSLRSRAAKAASRQGKFIMPFAFGVAPLLQVFGADVPLVPSSRAVQIPLFRFSAGQGDRQIIDHIMVMLYPRADHKASGIGGPAPVTNRGTAMLVMRNFGYLGLHSVVHSKSSLARDRLVDFTGEIQLRRREEGDEDAFVIPGNNGKDLDVQVVPEWHKNFVAEPTAGGGRIKPVSLRSKEGDACIKASESPLYAQELAPLRLHPSTISRSSTTSTFKGQRGRGHHASGDDIEPYFHSSFCNELLCHPRLLHNCPKGNIVIKVEMREMEWLDEYDTFVAHLPAGGPTVLNPRRGPFLVQGAYSSCSARCLDPHFLDEFKLRLPLILSGEKDGTRSTRQVSLFFTVYRLSFSSRKKWGKRFRNTKTGRKVDEIVGDIAGENMEDVDAGTNFHLIQLSCGHLPLVSNSAVVPDGNHDIKMTKIARLPRSDLVEKGEIESSTLVLTDIPGIDDHEKGESDDLLGEDTESAGSGYYLADTVSATSAVSEITEGSRSKVKNKGAVEPICLQVRLAVHSSVHCQNSVLNDFLGQEPDPSISVESESDQLSKTLELSRDRIFELSSAYMSTTSASDSHHDNEKLLIASVDISKMSMCPVTEISEHLLRVTSQLWKVIVCGTAEADLVWANPAAFLPLRVQAFASLLHILGSFTVFSSKRGLSQLDGSSKLNLIALGRVLALSFDEGLLFGESAGEALSKDFLSSLLAPPLQVQQAANDNKPSKERRRKHVRSNFEFASGSIDGLQVTSSEVGDLDGASDAFRAVGMLDHSSPAVKSSGESPRTGVDGKLHAPERLQEHQSQDESMRVDSVTDFRSALKVGSEWVEDDGPIYDGSSTGSRAALALVKAYSGPQGMNRRWMTAPAPGLATIREDGDDIEASANVLPEVPHLRREKGPLDSLDTELFVKPAKSAVKQMRVPKIKKASDPTSITTQVDSHDTSLGANNPPSHLNPVFDTSANESRPLESLPGPLPKESSDVDVPGHIKTRSNTLPSTDAEIEKAGSSFLDAVEMSLGLGGMIGKVASTGEGDRVGQANHRKTRSSCSIDWSIPNDDIGKFVFEPPPSRAADPIADSVHVFDESMTTLSGEKEISTLLPNYMDRLVALKGRSAKSGRFFPFTYEVIIMQWAGILNEQRRNEPEITNDASKNPEGDVDSSLSDAAARTGGVAIACAPVLFEIMKQSLGWRIANIHQRVRAENIKSKFPPLVILDEAIMSSLERIIESITLACIDFRNFDAWETRQTCIDVNDCVVLFLRDLFAFLDPKCVYRLVMVYLTRLLTANIKLQDRDSSTGLRCSWEVTKLQLNAVSALVRFPDFMKVNSPQFNSVGESLFRASGFSAVSFFDSMLETHQKLNPQLLIRSDTAPAFDLYAMTMKPHWLAEIVVDVCLFASEHAEQNIQRRASSVLLEMFWGQSQESMIEGNSSIIASMYVSFLEKILTRVNYISRCFSSKSQVRQDLLRPVAFILQSAPAGILRALWRKLCAKASGKGFSEKFGCIGFSVPSESVDDSVNENQRKLSRTCNEWKQDADIFDMFSLLNLTLATLEYEGSDEHAEAENPSDDDGPHLAIWRKEFLLVRELETPDKAKRRRLMAAFGKVEDRGKDGVEYATTSSRRWHSHDGSIVLIKTTQQIVRELRHVLEPSEEAQSFFNPARRKASAKSKHGHQSSLGSKESRGPATGTISFTYMDTVIFVRAATSVYLHALTLSESDICTTHTLKASLEIVKIFGLKIFNEAVGETLQHWMRVVSFHCGSRRSEVRVQASDFLELILRSTWDIFGSFFRIRLPVLAVQTEVMERIVATAAGRHYREQRMMGIGIDLFSNGSAEASLAPLWRTLDRLHHQSASQNVAFRSALMRLAEKVKKLFRAYVAAHALSFLHQAKPKEDGREENDSVDAAANNLEAQTLIRASRISIHRVINASAGYSKQFLGFYSTSLEHSTVAHNEAVEDAFLAAADVFSPTELPDHRVAWMRRLAKFHSVRNKYAEEATCHYNIHITLQQASSLHGALWFSTPFLPWTNTNSDGMHLDGEGPAGDPDDTDFEDPYDNDFGRQIEKTNSFRRIFYRNENSIRISGGELEAGTSKYAFYGVTLPSEYSTVSPWTSMREMETSMLEEAEAAGDLFLKAGIVASSRLLWSLAVRHYSEKFSYAKLKHVYERLANTVVSWVPPLDSNQTEVAVTVPLGRFYRVWFHGGAPDELIGAEFVYRTASNVTLEDFGKELKEVIRCIIPDKTPIHLVLDGKAEERETQSYSGFRMGAQLEPVRVKVTPLRSMVRKSSIMRGLPEWFHDYIETAFTNQGARTSYGGKGLRRNSSMYGDGSVGEGSTRPRHRDHGPTYSASVFSSSGNSTMMANRRSSQGGGASGDSRRFRQEIFEGELVGADKFSFMQPINKGRDRGARDWLRGSSGDFAAKTLRVTQLQVGQAFPACVSRQAVVHRVVFTQSPLEAAGDSICQWCAILFRTAIATNGMAVLGTNYDPGIGIEAAKVVSDCIHSSRVKEMGLYLLKKNTNFQEEEEGDTLQSYDRLAEDEVKKLQLRLARSLVVFMELLHLMIARNRELLLEVIQERKRGDAGSRHSHSASMSRGDVSLSDGRSNRSNATRHSSLNANDGASDFNKTRGDESNRSFHRRKGSQGHLSVANDDYSVASVFVSEKARTDSAIGIQSELQRAFISLCKDLHPKILGIMGGASPRWLKQCTQDNYFSTYSYRHVKIPMAEELSFVDIENTGDDDDDDDDRHSELGRAASSRSHASFEGTGIPMHTTSTHGTRNPGSPSGSVDTGNLSLASRSSDAGRSQQSSSKRSMKSYERGVDRVPPSQDQLNRMASI